MKYRIKHTTTYDYDETVPLCRNVVCLAPRSDAAQTCREHRLTVTPAPADRQTRTDYFGNLVSCFSIREGHRQLKVEAISTVWVTRTAPGEGQKPSPPWEQIRAALAEDRTPGGLDAYQFAFDSPHVPSLPPLREYARTSFTAGRPILEAVADLTSRIHADFTYDGKSTTVNTPVLEAFEKRRGVCQDMAHVQIGCLRSIGLAARYVSGYLRTLPPPGKPRLVGADASHAWLSVYCGRLGWIDVDPTNDRFVASDHVTLAWGREYFDVCPISGLFVGGGRHAMRVSVDVAPVDEAAQS